MKYTKIFTFITMILLLVTSVTAIAPSLTLQWDNWQETKTIEQGVEAVYYSTISPGTNTFTELKQTAVLQDANGQIVAQYNLGGCLDESSCKDFIKEDIHNVLPEDHNNKIGVYTLTVDVEGKIKESSNYPYIDFSEITLRVVSASPNNLPQISSLNDQVIDELTMFSHTFQVSDADLEDDPVCFANERDLPSWLRLSGEKNCVLSGTAINETADKEYAVTVRVSDGKDESSTSFKILVKDIKYVEPENNAPKIIGINDQVIDELTMFSHTFQVSDQDADDNPVCFKQQNTDFPDWLSLSGDNNCKLSGIAPDVNEDKTHQITVWVTDGKDRNKTNFKLTVRDLYVPPQNGAPVADFYWTPLTPIRGTVVSFFSNSTDDKVVTKYEWDFNLDGVTDDIVANPKHTFETSGRHTVKLKVYDEEGLSSTKTHIITVVDPALVIKEVSCNENVVQGHAQYCTAYVENENAPDSGVNNAKVTFRYLDTDEFVGDETICYTNEKGYCHISPIINKEPGFYTVYATATKTGYKSYLNKDMTSTFEVWMQRYRIENLKVYDDVFTNENDTFYRNTSMYAAFDVRDLWLDNIVPPGTDLVEDVFLRVNNANPANFEEWTVPIPLSRATPKMINTAKATTRQTASHNSIATVSSSVDNVGAYKYYLDFIPITDDFLGDGKVFAFVFNLTNHTAGQEDKNVNVLNNPIVFNPPKIVYVPANDFVEIDLSKYVNDIETKVFNPQNPQDEIRITYKDTGLFDVNRDANNNKKFKVFAPMNYEYEQTILFTANDLDGSQKEVGILFKVKTEDIVKYDPIAVIKHNLEYKEAIYTNEVLDFDGTDSYDPDGGEIKSYKWFVDGVDAGYNSIYRRGFGMAKSYKIGLEVTDDEGATGYKEITITVEKRPAKNIPPIAGFNINPSSPYINQTTTFDARNLSYDPDGTIDTYKWIIDEEPYNHNGPYFQANFDTKGLHNVCLTVIDDKGANNSACNEFIVREKPVGPSNPPIAIINAPEHSFVGETVFIDGSKSYDEDGDEIVNYVWSMTLAGEEMFLDEGMSGFNFEFEKSGLYRLTLWVEDSTSMVGVAKAEILVHRAARDRSKIGEEDGLFVDYFDIWGPDEYGVVSLNDPFIVLTTVTNGREDKISDLRVTFSLPELGYQIKSGSYSLRAGESETFEITDYLPFTYNEIEPGEYTALITVKADKILRTKYFPLVIN